MTGARVGTRDLIVAELARVAKVTDAFTVVLVLQARGLTMAIAIEVARFVDLTIITQEAKMTVAPAIVPRKISSGCTTGWTAAGV